MAQALLAHLSNCQVVQQRGCLYGVEYDSNNELQQDKAAHNHEDAKKEHRQHCTDGALVLLRKGQRCLSLAVRGSGACGPNGLGPTT